MSLRERLSISSSCIYTRCLVSETMANCQEITSRPMDIRIRHQPVFAIMFIFCFVLLSVNTLLAATRTAPSCSRSDVGDAVARAANGDTVLIPAGHCTWTNNLTIKDKYLTVRGAGIDETVITDGVSKSKYPNIPQVLVWTMPRSGLSRLSGITFKGGGIPDSANKGMVLLSGSSHQFRVDHNKFIPTQTSALMVIGNHWGVVDHNTFDLSANHGYGIYIHREGFGDESWAEGSTLGTEQNVFIEDNLFTQDQSKGYFYPGQDGWSGHRIVVRYNKFHNTKASNHGTETSGRWRSARQFEYYNNAWTLDMHGHFEPAAISIRGGTGVVFNNTVTVTNGMTNNLVEFKYLRANASYQPWGKCPNAWDLSADRCIDQIGVGRGALLSGFSPSRPEWPEQIDDPAYAWNNRVNGTISPPISPTPTVVRIGRDVIHSPKPDYTPYTYPHPLTTTSETTSSGPTAPSALSVK